jgi:hypothetical protein
MQANVAITQHPFAGFDGDALALNLRGPAFGADEDFFNVQHGITSSKGQRSFQRFSAIL